MWLNKFVIRRIGKLENITENIDDYKTFYYPIEFV